MEYASGGELFDRIVKANRFSEDEARYFFQQLISGVAWCHREVRVTGGLGGCRGRVLLAREGLLARGCIHVVVVLMVMVGVTAIEPLPLPLVCAHMSVSCRACAIGT